jgi:LEA14-like dessication related protein
MKKIGPILFVVAAYAVYQYFANSRGFGKNLSIKFKNIGFDLENTKKSLFAKIYTNLHLELINPTKFEAKITSLNLKFYFDGREVGKVEKLGTLNISPESFGNIDVSAALNTLTLFSNIQNAIQHFINKKPIELTIKGIVNSSAGSINIDQKAVLT